MSGNLSSKTDLVHHESESEEEEEQVFYDMICLSVKQYLKGDFAGAREILEALESDLSC
jgi:hypothetical protein